MSKVIQPHGAVKAVNNPVKKTRDRASITIGFTEKLDFSPDFHN